MQLLDLIKQVNDKTLSREQLEEYRDNLVVLFAQMQLELADLKKKEAIYLLEHKKDTNVETQREWDATKEGQREIELRYYSKATEKMVSSLKDRVYRLY